MIDKEVAELRRRFRQDRTAITPIYGCYINQFAEIVATFDDSLTMLPLEEQEKYLDLLKKGISGSIGKTLSDISFSTSQVLDSDEHRLLSRLRDSKLADEEARDELYREIAGSLKLGDNSILVLLACDTYDVPFRAKDGTLQADSGDLQFTYFVCSICPVKETNPVLRYDAAEKVFHNHGAEWVAGNPELGFLFPAFDDRAANLYGALLYNRSKDDSREAFVDAVFHTRPPMAVGIQKDTFREVLIDALEEECSPKVVQTVHTQLRELAVAHKEAHDPEPLRISGPSVSQILEGTGVSEEKAAAFRVRFDEAFGSGSELPPQNLLNSAQLEYKTPDVVIKVNPDREDLIQVREIGGVRYLLINADEGIEINGVQVR